MNLNIENSQMLLNQADIILLMYKMAKDDIIIAFLVKFRANFPLKEELINTPRKIIELDMII